MKEIYIKLPNNKENEVPTKLISPPNLTSIARNRLYLIELLIKGAPWKPQLSQAITKAIGCPL